jgi:hypothetical protein
MGWRNTRGVQAPPLLGRHRQLFERDPLREALTKAALALVDLDPDSREYDRASRRLGLLREQVRKKYGFGLYLPEPKMLRHLQAAGVPDEEVRELLWHVASGADQGPVLVRRNWGVPSELRALFVQIRGREPPPSPSPLEPHTLTVTIDLERVGKHDLKNVAQLVKKAIRAALAELPPALQTPPSRRLPKRLGFLRKMSEAVFQRELRRYDLATRHGVSFRLIALVEERERRGQTSVGPPDRRRVGFSVKGEDAVKKSVSRLFEAIQEKPWPGLRRAADPRAGVEQYACPDHGGNACPTLDCPYAKKFLRAFNARRPA